MSNAGRNKKNLTIETGNFPKHLKVGTGKQLQKDLSHKVSAKQVNTIFQTVIRNPAHARHLLPDIQAATDLSGLSKPVQKRFTGSLEYLEDHRPYTKAPMSPRSAKALHVVANTFANKNKANLRPRPSDENRSIGQYPHFNIESEALTPRSEKLNAAVTKFARYYGKGLSPQLALETRSYTGLIAFIRSRKKSAKTGDQVAYASKARQGKL